MVVGNLGGLVLPTRCSFDLICGCICRWVDDDVYQVKIMLIKIDL